jgi:hypothetical protein
MYAGVEITRVLLSTKMSLTLHGRTSAPITAACFAGAVARGPSVTRTPATGPSTRAARMGARQMKPIGRWLASASFSKLATLGSTSHTWPLSA